MIVVPFAVIIAVLAVYGAVWLVAYVFDWKPFC